MIILFLLIQNDFILFWCLLRIKYKEYNWKYVRQIMEAQLWVHNWEWALIYYKKCADKRDFTIHDLDSSIEQFAWCLSIDWKWCRRHYAISQPETRGEKRNRKLVSSLDLRALKSLPTTVLCSRASSLSMNFSPVVWLPTHRVARFSASRSNSLAAGFTCNKRLSSTTISLACNPILYHR